MRALQCLAFGPIEDLAVNDIADPALGPGHVLVDVHAAGLNFPDTLCVQGLYQFRPDPPFTPGQEGAGVVAAVGEGVSHVKLGDKVAFFALNGAFAQKIALPAASVAPLPQDADLDTAAAFTLAYGTAHYALTRRAKLQAGERLFVLGAAGGVGLAAVEIGKALGATVIAGASSEEKLQLARDHGADDGFVYPRGPLSRDDQKAIANQIKTRTGGQGVDVVFDPVGDAYAEPAIRALAWEGRHLVVGFAAGEIPTIPLNLTLLKGSQIMGVFWGAWVMSKPHEAAADFKDLYAMLASGQVRPHISARYPLDQAVDGFRALCERRALGKLIITMT